MITQLDFEGNEFALIANAKCLVGEVLARTPVTRDNDLDLIFETWSLQGVAIPIGLREMIKAKCYTPETITRARRMLQNDEKQWQASENVQVGRDRQEKKYHSFFRNK